MSPAQLLDRDWRKRLPREPSARFWELFMLSTVLDAGYEVSTRRREDAADFEYLDGGRPVIVECTSTTSGLPSLPDSVPEIPAGTAELVPVEACELRILQALHEKIAQYRKRVAEGRVAPDNPYLIAINIRGALRSRPDISPPLVLRACLGFGAVSVAFDRKTLKTSEPFVEEQRVAEKRNKAPVAKGLFADKETAEPGISGVVFGNVDSFNHPGIHGLLLARALSYLPNPFSSNPLLAPPRFSFDHWIVEVADGLVVGFRKELTATPAGA